MFFGQAGGSESEAGSVNRSAAVAFCAPHSQPASQPATAQGAHGTARSPILLRRPSALVPCVWDGGGRGDTPPRPSQCVVGAWARKKVGARSGFGICMYLHDHASPCPGGAWPSPPLPCPALPNSSWAATPAALRTTTTRRRRKGARIRPATGRTDQPARQRPWDCMTCARAPNDSVECRVERAGYGTMHRVRRAQYGGRERL